MPRLGRVCERIFYGPVLSSVTGSIFNISEVEVETRMHKAVLFTVSLTAVTDGACEKLAHLI